MYKYNDETFRKFTDLVKEHKLFEPTYGFYALHTIWVTILIGFSLYGVAVVDPSNTVVVIALAILMGFSLVQAGFLGHDLTHNQVFRRKGLNRFFGAIVWGIFAGVSQQYWFEKHDTHHKETNRDGHDPDIDLPFYFSRQQVANLSPLCKKYYLPIQHYLFLPLISFGYYSIILRSYAHMLMRPRLSALPEFLYIIVHYVVFYFAITATLSGWPLVLYIAVATLAGGFYLGISFAPNHKGEEVFDEEQEIGWREQIIATRNVHATPFNFFLVGGLNHQIEHHLYPFMPRWNYQKLQPLVREFCKEQGLPFHETSLLGSFVEITNSLKETADDYAASTKKVS